MNIIDLPVCQRCQDEPATEGSYSPEGAEIEVCASCAKDIRREALDRRHGERTVTCRALSKTYRSV